MKVTNRISQALGRGANERHLMQIRNIVIHHTASRQTLDNGQPMRTANHENWWINPQAGMGAPNARGGYHELVLVTGEVEINMQDERRTWGAGDGNRFDLWHIAVSGTHLNDGVRNVNSTQLESLAQRIAQAFKRFGWHTGDLARIIRHRDVQGQATTCNDLDLTSIRNRVRALLEPQKKPCRKGEMKMINTLRPRIRVNVNQAVPLRPTAGTKHPAIRQLPRGTKVEFVRYSVLANGNPGNWVMVIAPNTNGKGSVVGFIRPERIGLERL